MKKAHELMAVLALAGGMSMPGAFAPPGFFERPAPRASRTRLRAGATRASQSAAAVATRRRRMAKQSRKINRSRK